jgi:cadmium resistance protein CadD (predicted permease)
MCLILSILAASVTTFAATNLDDIFLLTVFFARRVPKRRIVAGQYIGFTAIVAVSLAVVWGVAPAIPRDWIRMLGILPLALGLGDLLRIRRPKSGRDAVADGSLSVFSIAAITLVNGADNLGVYIPFFLVSRSHLWLVVVVYGLLVLVWCAAGRWLGSHALVLKSLDRWGHWITPFVLIGLGSYILLFMSR